MDVRFDFSEYHTSTADRGTETVCCDDEIKDLFLYPGFKPDLYFVPIFLAKSRPRRQKCSPCSLVTSYGIPASLLRGISISRLDCCPRRGIGVETSKDFVVWADDLDAFFLGGFGVDEVEDVHAFYHFSCGISASMQGWVGDGGAAVRIRGWDMTWLMDEKERGGCCEWEARRGVGWMREVLCSIGVFFFF